MTTEIEGAQQQGASRDYFRLAWTAGAATTVVLPMLMYVIAVLVRGPVEEGSQDEQSSSWWWWNNNNNNNGADDDQYGNNNNNNNQNGDDDANNAKNSGGWWWWSNNNEDNERQREENQGRGAMIFVYLWTLMLFAILVWYGRLVFRRNAHSLPLVSAMVVFWNLSLMGAILVGNLGINYEERELEERGWLAQFGACLTLTYVCLLLYCTVFIYWVRRRMACNANSIGIAPVYPTSPCVADTIVTDAYYHQDSDISGGSALEQREPSTTNKPPWAFY